MPATLHTSSFHGAAWSEIALGRAQPVERADAGGQRILIARSCTGSPEPALTTRQRHVVERAAAGAAYAEIAYELALELSTVASHVAHALALLRLNRIELPLLVLGDPPMQWGAHGELLITLPGIDGGLVPELSDGERDIVRLLLRGASNLRVANERGSKQRTVANQLARVFKKLRVQSRMELAALVAIRSARRSEIRGVPQAMGAGQR